jgi:tetratricopeptide (TPR) repeat protein
MVEKTAEAEQESTTQQSSDHVSSGSTEFEALVSDTESVGEPEVAEQKTATPEEPTSFAEADLAKAEEYKTKGNEFFKMNKFQLAIDQYTEAIFQVIPCGKKAIYYCNRALANLRMENNHVALLDATEAIKLDAENVKAFYRKGQA